MNEAIREFELDIVNVFNNSKAPTEAKRIVLQSMIYQIEIAKAKILSKESGGVKSEQST